MQGAPIPPIRKHPDSFRAPLLEEERWAGKDHRTSSQVTRDPSESGTSIRPSPNPGNNPLRTPPRTGKSQRIDTDPGGLSLHYLPCRGAGSLPATPPPTRSLVGQRRRAATRVHLGSAPVGRNSSETTTLAVAKSPGAPLCVTTARERRSARYHSRYWALRK